MSRLTVPACALLLVLLAATTLTLAGCGNEADTRAERLADSLQDQVDNDLPDGPAYSVIDANCLPRGGRYRCTVDLTTTPDATVEEFSVRLGSNGCWVATSTGLGKAAGRELSDEELTPRTLRGCIDDSG